MGPQDTDQVATEARACKCVLERATLDLVKDLPVTARYPDDAAIDHLFRSVIDGSLPKAQWTHAAHFAVVMWVLRRRPEPWGAGRPAESAMPPLIRAYNLASGQPNTDDAGYHETITLASVAAARHFLAGHDPSRPLHELLELLMAGPLGESRWILAHWSRERLFSVEARRGWVEPDLRPLPVQVAPGDQTVSAHDNTAKLP